MREKVKEWIEKAEKDLRAAKILYNEGIHDYTLFHVQQAVEKYLKAFLTLHNIPFRKTHDITYLIEICKKIDKEFETLYRIGADKLYPIGTLVRYPSPYKISKEEAKEAIEIAEKVREFVLKKLGIKEG